VAFPPRSGGLPCAAPRAFFVKRVSKLLLVLWAGSLWSVSWVAWTLFHSQSDRHLAGVVVGPLLSIEAYVGVAVTILALLLPGRTRFIMGYVAAALLAIIEWALRPVMDIARVHGSAVGLSFGAWHGVSMSIYLVAGIALLIQVWKSERR
jgi:hypothetical protein